MEQVEITVRVAPDALVKVYNQTRDEVVYVDNANANGETAPLRLPAGDTYFIDVTVF